MKTTFLKIISFTALLCSAFALVAQPKQDTLANKGGVYMTSYDYLNHRLTFPINCLKPEGDNIKVHSLFWNQSIEVVYNGKKRTLQKEDVYAYRDCDGSTYRFYNNADYIISQAKGIYIYMQQTRGVAGQNYRVVNQYFFSRGPVADIKALNLANLLSVYADNTKFCDLLNANFSHGENISEYDFSKKSYKVVMLYEETEVQPMPSTR